MNVNKQELLTIPNILSYIRILLIPLFVWIYITADDPKDYYLASFIILLSGLTDLLDGKIARKFDQITDLGKTLDPVADKLTQAAIAFSLMFRYSYMWLLVVLFVIKELFMGINGLILLKKGKKLDGAKWYGKVSTAVFYVATVALIAFPEMDITLVTILLVITSIFLSLSFIAYIPVFVKMYRS